MSFNNGFFQLNHLRSKLYRESSRSSSVRLTVLNSICASILLTQFGGLGIQQSYAQSTDPQFNNRSAADVLTLPQVLAQVKNYQTSQGVLETQQYIGQTSLQHSRLWENPTLAIEQTGFQNDKDRELSISISQPLDIFGQRKAAQNLAQVSISKIDLKQELYAAQLDLIVRHQWNLLVILQQEKLLAEQQLAVSQENFQITQKRYKAGSIAQVDVDRVQMTHLENLRAFQQIELQEKIAKKQVAKLWGNSDIGFRAVESLDHLLSKQLESKISSYLNQNFMERSFQLGQQQNQAEMRYLKTQSRPNPTLSLGMNRTRTPTEQTESQVVLGVEFPIQIFNRQQYSLGVVKARQHALDRQRQFSREQVELEIDILLAELKGLITQYQQITDQQIPLAIRVQQKTLHGFDAGKFSVTDVQQATTQLQDVRLRKVQLLRDIEQRAVVAESLSLGVAPDTVMATDALEQLNQTLWQDIQSMSSTVGE